jgi:hypothetical protein
MTLLTHRGQGPAFGYTGQSVHVLAGQSGLPPGFAAMELTIPPHFAGPIPHAHDEFDEAIYVLSGRLLVHGDGEPAEAVSGSRLRRWQLQGSAERGLVRGVLAGPGARAGARGWGLGWSGLTGVGVGMLRVS